MALEDTLAPDLPLNVCSMVAFKYAVSLSEKKGVVNLPANEIDADAQPCPFCGRLDCHKWGVEEAGHDGEDEIINEHDEDELNHLEWVAR